jgi:hypothetical protein
MLNINTGKIETYENNNVVLNKVYYFSDGISDLKFHHGKKLDQQTKTR